MKKNSSARVYRAVVRLKRRIVAMGGIVMLAHPSLLIMSVATDQSLLLP
jgi:hypothetical protein